MHEYSCKRILLQDVGRVFPGLFPLQRIGFIKNIASSAMELYSGKLELCFRFSSENDVCHDVINGVAYDTPFPNIFLKTPELVHGPLSNNRRDAIYFLYDASLYERMKAHGFWSPPYIWHFQMNQEMSGALKRISELAGHAMEYGVADKIDILALQLFQSVMLNRAHPAETAYEQAIETKIRRIASYIQLNFNTSIDVESLYRQNGFSRRSFFRHWKQFYSMPPLQYIQELKLEHAGHLLLETSMPVGEICEELNFKNPHYLSMLFKKHFGISPTQYRKQSPSFSPPN